MNSSLPRAPGAPAPVGAPWFVQFWPVFIAVLMAVSILASLATVAIAYRHADVDVRIAEGIGGVALERGVAKPVDPGPDQHGSPR